MSKKIKEIERLGEEIRKIEEEEKEQKEEWRIKEKIEEEEKKILKEKRRIEEKKVKMMSMVDNPFRQLLSQDFPVWKPHEVQTAQTF